MLAGGSTRIPKIVQLVSGLFDGKQPNRVSHVDQDTVVAHGAALQAAVLSGQYSPQMRDFLLLDATPFSLGIGTAGGLMAPLVLRNTTMPTRAAATLTTTFDGQPGVLVEVYEGERARTRDNTLLARVVLPGIPPAPRGVPRLRVTFEMDVGQHLVVTVTDTATGRSNRVTVPGSTRAGTGGRGRGLTDSEVVDMVVDANVAAARAAARARFRGYVDGLREVLHALDPALHSPEIWLMMTQDASIVEYDRQRKKLEAVVRPLAEQFAAAVASDGVDGVDIPEVDVVDEEMLRTWAVAVVAPDDMPPAASHVVHEDDDMGMWA